MNPWWLFIGYVVLDTPVKVFAGYLILRVKAEVMGARVQIALLNAKQSAMLEGVVCDPGMCKRAPVVPEAETVAFLRLLDDEGCIEEPETPEEVSTRRIVTALIGILALLCIAIWAGSRTAVV